MSHTPTGRVPDWLAPLAAARSAGLMPRARYLLLVLDVPDVHPRYSIVVPADYRPEPTDDFWPLIGLDVEIFFGAETGFHRLRLVCESCVEARIGRLVLLPETRSIFIVLKRGEA
ncbi:hypothetical protein [Cupriavidus campinensis]